jgi:hypothetical protein
MPALPWKSLAPVDAAGNYVVMASRLPLARYRDIPRFLAATLAIRRQLATSDGLVGYALDARLLRRTFWTLSVWRDDDALAAFAGADPHRRDVERIRPLMNSTTFVTWAVQGNQLPVSWSAAKHRIDEAP